MIYLMGNHCIKFFPVLQILERIWYFLNALNYASPFHQYEVPIWHFKIIWLLNITENHCVNTPNSNSMFALLYGKSSYDVRNCFIFKVDQLGLEPRTSRLWVCCSNQLSYKSVQIWTAFAALCECKYTSYCWNLQEKRPTMLVCRPFSCIFGVHNAIDKRSYRCW